MSFIKLQIHSNLDYVKLSILLDEIDEQQQDILSAFLGELGFEAFLNEAGYYTAYCLGNLFRLNEVQQCCEQLGYAGKFQIEELAKENWNAKWEEDFQPISIEKEIGVRATFHEPLNARFELIIEPKMSFGTGHHATTEMMLRNMLALNFNEKTVIDFGCGTGILAIASEKFGATYVFGNDIDEWAVENAQENASLNHCKQTTFELGGAEILRNKQANIILANINRNVLTQSMNQIDQSLLANGYFVCSGFLHTELPLVIQKAADFGLIFVSDLVKDEWTSAVFKKQTS